MDQDTRNKLQRATQQIRRLLEDDFTEQLEGTFDILPSGKLLECPGKHLNARQRLSRQKLIDAMNHIRSGGKSDKEAVNEYTREAAFTFLNRFVALRMLETRGLLQECVSKGDSSSGFKEFCGLAPGLSGLEDGGYRLYLECLFDELTVEVKVLFDRRDSASLLWPRRGALAALLDILGQGELADVWNEDETIGWVYQYFNSDEDRRRARYKPNGKPKAPGNSYELAVRNQFFTPRYVVEFLTDNTLGRIWYEMSKGQTKLVEECRYLVRRPSEVFLRNGQPPPIDGSDTEKDPNQEELPKKTVYIPHRLKKDPRDLKILDPACGSGHFLLYAFDLLILIYDEAWHDEMSSKSEVTGNRLRDDYLKLTQLHAALPGLVLAHNLHGIDIDPRAAQIAAMALWMRGQRTFNQFKVVREQRPAIARSNIVCAEAMPGETAFLEEFIAEHSKNDAEGRFLASLVRKVFAAMQLAGEAGSLLRIEEDLAADVVQAKKKWLERPEYKQRTLFDDGPTIVQQELDLTSGISDEAFWGEAEHRIYEALRIYSERSGGFQRRLFAADAARGFAFIDLCRERYDVVLMNPPFGEVSEPSREYLYNALPETARDLFAGFVKHYCRKLATGGRLGALTNRTAFFSDFLAGWRVQVLAGEDASLRLMADLGYGVLDAVVEAAAYVCERSSERRAVFVNALSEVQKDQRLQQAVRSLEVGNDDQRVYTKNVGLFSRIPDTRFAYHLGDRWISLIADNDEHPLYVSRAGLTSGDDFRFVRLSWETPEEDAFARWKLLAKGGDFGRYLTNLHLKIDWTAEQWLSRTRNSELYGRAGVTYTERTTSNLSARVLNSGCCFSGPGPGVIPRNEAHGHVVLAFINSFAATYCLEALVGGGDFSVKGSAARHLEPGYINHLPTFPVTQPVVELFRIAMEELVRRLCDLIVDESHPLFRGQLIVAKDTSLEQISESIQHFSFQKLRRCYEIIRESESRIALLLDITGGTEAEAFSDTGWPWPDGSSTCANDSLEQFIDLDAESTHRIPSQMVGREVHFRFQNKLAHYLHAGVEAISHDLGVSPEQVCMYLASHGKAPRELQQRVAKTLLSLSFGVVLGHWPETIIGSQLVEYDAECIFDQLPERQPGRRYLSSIPTIVVCDVGHPNDASNLVEKYLNRKLGRYSTEILRDIGRVLLGESGGDREIGVWFRKHFFDYHIKTYSKSRRKAPIYWQLATPSATYSVWLYYHHFTKDTFFQLINEHVKPKLNHERQKLERVRSEGGADPSRSQRKEIEDQERFVAELASMAEEIERIAPLWKPNLNDGVIINFAPLWRLVPQNKSWQKECKSWWETLVNGEYDWAHLAMHLWPERVVPKCVTNASFAIAHGLEDVFWEQDDRERFQPKEEPEGGWKPVIERLVKERSSAAVKAALQSLLGARVPSSSSGKSRRRSRTS